MLTVAAAVETLERIAPPALAADWDNVGLLLGEGAAEVRRIMTCLTVTPDSAAEAVAESAQLVVTHHPILFRAVKRLTDATAEGRILLSLARGGVAVYSPHTAFDDAPDGINDLLARRLGLTDVGPCGGATTPGRARWSCSLPTRTWTAWPPRCSPPGRGASASTASVVFAFTAWARFSAPTRRTRRSAKRAGARRSRNGGWRRSVPSEAWTRWWRRSPRPFLRGAGG